MLCCAVLAAERGALTRKPLLDQSVDVIRDEGHGGEISHLRLADDLDASTLLPPPVDIGRLHAADGNQMFFFALFISILTYLRDTTHHSDLIIIV